MLGMLGNFFSRKLRLYQTTFSFIIKENSISNHWLLIVCFFFNDNDTHKVCIKCQKYYLLIKCAGFLISGDQRQDEKKRAGERPRVESVSFSLHGEEFSC